MWNNLSSLNTRGTTPRSLPATSGQRKQYGLQRGPRVGKLPKPLCPLKLGELEQLRHLWSLSGDGPCYSCEDRQSCHVGTVPPPATSLQPVPSAACRATSPANRQAPVAPAPEKW